MSDDFSDFDSVSALIFSRVLIHARRFGGDLDDLYQEAVLTWCSVRHRYDPFKAKLSTWTAVVVDRRLKDISEAAHARRGREYAAGTPDAAFSRDRADWMDGLTEDGLEVAALALDPPEELIELRASNRPRDWAAAVRRYLRDVLGWDDERVKAATRAT